jgi:outer membrane protein TolC
MHHQYFGPGSRVLAGAALLVLAGCVHAPPRIDGAAGAPSSPAAMWSPPPEVIRRAASVAAAPDSVHMSPERASALTLADVVDIALRESPVTRASWAEARAAADVYGATRGSLYPTLTGSVAASRTRSLSSPGRPAGERSQYGPGLNLDYLVLDMGGRSGSIDVARQTAIAADLAHNAAVQTTILQVEDAAFGYLSTRSQRDAQRAAVSEAQAVLDAANERHSVGLATIADVLQAKTALSQAQLSLETLEGQLQTTRGSLAAAMGLSASTNFDIPDIPATDSVHFVSDSVDALIALAVRNRPELAQAQAEAQAAHSDIRVARSAALPSLAFTGTGARNTSSVSTFAGNTYTLNLGLQIPLFAGFSHSYDVRAAQENFDAAQARARLTRQQIELQVFTSYYSLRTATDRVHTSTDLLASATESESVARGRYQEGVGSIVDVLIAQTALANARAQSIDARWQWRAALAQLAHDVGTLSARGEPLIPSPSSPSFQQ